MLSTMETSVELTLPLFPLSAHILPEGRMSLRIFEPRYTRMVKECCASQSTFVICMLNNQGKKEDNTHIHLIGTQCKIIDFDLLDDGLLGVKVEGIDCVKIANIETEHDGLRRAVCEPIHCMQGEIKQAHIAPMDQRLREVFERYPDVQELYEQVKMDDPKWVINRWLELLPVGAEQKQYFLAQGNYEKIVDYLTELIE